LDNRGKGTPRRKVKKVHKSAGTDDKKLQTALKKLNVQPIQAIEEVNMFKSDGNVIHFSAPKGTSLQAHICDIGLVKVHVAGQLLLASWSTAPLAASVRVLTLPSPRLSTRQHLRHLRKRRGQGADRACPRHPQPARPRLARIAAQTRRELPEHAEGEG
jgi:hypothetical protein